MDIHSFFPSFVTAVKTLDTKNAKSATKTKTFDKDMNFFNVHFIACFCVWYLLSSRVD